jgi:hypothetical protein
METTFDQLFEDFCARAWVGFPPRYPKPPFLQTIVLDDEGDLWIEVGGGANNGTHEKAKGGEDEGAESHGNEEPEGGTDTDDDDGATEGGGNGEDDNEVTEGWDNSDGEEDGSAMVNSSGSGGDHGEGKKRCSKNESANRPQKVYRFKVSSRIMRRASPVWRSMLFGPWLERKPMSGEEWLVALPDDSPVAIAVLLLVVHGRLDLLPRWQDHIPYHAPEAISRILSAADKYDMMQLFWPFARDWIQYARLPSGTNHSHCTEHHQKTLYRLNIAWHLGIDNVVSYIVRYLTYEMAEETLDALLAVADDGPLVGISLSLREAIDTAAASRQGAIQAALDFFHRLMENLEDPTMGNPAIGCTRAMFGKVSVSGQRLGRVPYFKNSVIIPALQKHHALDRHHCNAVVLIDVLSRLHNDWENIPTKAKDVSVSVNDLMDVIRRILGVSADFGAEPPVLLQGHSSCAQIVRYQFWSFDRDLRSLGPWHKPLKKEQREWLWKRSNMLSTLRVDLDKDYCI